MLPEYHCAAQCPLSKWNIKREGAANYWGTCLLWEKVVSVKCAKHSTFILLNFKACEQHMGSMTFFWAVLFPIATNCPGSLGKAVKSSKAHNDADRINSFSSARLLELEGMPLS